MNTVKLNALAAEIVAQEKGVDFRKEALAQLNMSEAQVKKLPPAMQAVVEQEASKIAKSSITEDEIAAKVGELEAEYEAFKAESRKACDLYTTKVARKEHSELVAYLQDVRKEKVGKNLLNAVQILAGLEGEILEALKENRDEISVTKVIERARQVVTSTRTPSLEAFIAFKRME